MACQTQIVGAIPPPPGIKANPADPSNQTRGTIALHTVCLTLVTLSIAVRVYVRAFIVRHFFWEDYFAIFAYVLTIVFSALLILSDHRGLERHLWNVPALKHTAIWKPFVFSSFVYIVLVACVKLSCLLLYRRVFSPSRKMRAFIHVGIFVVLAAYIAIFSSTVFEWRHTLPSHYLNTKSLPYASNTINSVTNIYILVLPMPCIWGLNMSLNRKLKVMSIFSLGVFTCAASIVRLGMTAMLYPSLDATWNSSPLIIFSVIEVNAGIICASLPVSAPFFDRHTPRSLGAFIMRLRSYTSSWREGKGSDDRSTRKSGFHAKWDGNGIRLQETTRTEKAGDQREAKITSKHPSEISETIEPWPVDKWDWMDVQTSYPLAVHIRNDV